MSRESVRRVIRSGATEPDGERRVQPRPKLGPLREAPARLPAENARRPRRERLTRIRIFEDLPARGRGGGPDAVRRPAACRSNAAPEASADACVPPSLEPGEAVRFDGSHEIVVVDVVAMTVTAAHVRLGQSCTVFLRACQRETHAPSGPCSA